MLTIVSRRIWSLTIHFVFDIVNTASCVVMMFSVIIVIMDYGITRGYVCLIDFYKNECGVTALQNEQYIMNYIVCQGDDAIALDMVFAILRDIVIELLYGIKNG